MVSNIKYGTGNAPDNDALERDIVKTPSTANVHMTHDEESPLLSRPDSTETTVKALKGVGTIVAVLLLGKMTTLEDGVLTLWLTMHRRIYFQRRCDSGLGGCWPHFFPI